LIATNAGLVRFDPKAPPQHRVINATDTVPIKPMFTVVVPGEDRYAGSLTALLEDHSGVVWCGTQKGLYRLEAAEGRFGFQPVNIEIPLRQTI
jgi:ligand-binding sensor domain-containing protein